MAHGTDSGSGATYLQVAPLARGIFLPSPAREGVVERLDRYRTSMQWRLRTLDGIEGLTTCGELTSVDRPFSPVGNSRLARLF